MKVSEETGKRNLWKILMSSVMDSSIFFNSIDYSISIYLYYYKWLSDLKILNIVNAFDSLHNIMTCEIWTSSFNQTWTLWSPLWVHVLVEQSGTWHSLWAPCIKLVSLGATGMPLPHHTGIVPWEVHGPLELFIAPVHLLNLVLVTSLCVLQVLQ